MSPSTKSPLASAGPPAALPLPVERMTDILALITPAQLTIPSGISPPAWLGHVIAGLAALLLVFGAKGVGALLPLLTSAIDLSQRDFVVTLQLAHESGEWMLRMQPLVLRPLELAANWTIPPGAQS